jgi:hypothetical protein
LPAPGRGTGPHQDAAEAVAEDMSNRAQGLAAGNFSALVEGEDPLHGGWSPSTRTLMGLAGGGLFLFGLTQKAPQACVLGTLGLALIAEAATNASLDDIAGLPRQVADRAGDMARMASNMVEQTAENLGFGQEEGQGQANTPRRNQPARRVPVMRGVR